MACGCRKGRIQPLGKKKTVATTDTTTKSSIGTYELKVNGFKTQTFGSRLEAEAARKRLGRGTVVER